MRLTVWEELSFQDFQDGRHGDHLGYRNGMSLTILNLHVALMPSTKFGLSVTEASGAEDSRFLEQKVSRFSIWPPRRPSWIAEQNDFSSSEFLCRSNPSHQVSAQSNLWFGRRCRLKTFKMAAIWRPSWISERNGFSNSESLCCSDASHQISAQSNIVWEEISFE